MIDYLPETEEGEADVANNSEGIVGFKGEIIMDFSKPDGTSQKLLDVVG